MGVIKRGILGGFSGKVGPVVGSTWKGIEVVKSKPQSVANPNTASQQTQRGKLREIVADARILLAAIIQPFWNPFAQQKSGYNAFVSENIDAYSETGLDTPSSFYASRGSLLGLTIGAATADESDSEIVVPWTDNSGDADALATDKVSVLVYNVTQDLWIVDTESETRDAGTVTVSTSDIAESDVLEVYLFASRPDVSKVSDSDHKQVTVAA